MADLSRPFIIEPTKETPHVVLDTGAKPMPLAVFHPFASEDTLDARHKASNTWVAQYGKCWIWNIEHHGKDHPQLPIKLQKESLASR